MVSLTATTTSRPNSFQLRLGFKCRTSKPSLIRIRRHVCIVDRRIRMCATAAGSAAKEGNGGDGKRILGNSSWESKDSSGDAFAGWFGTDSGGSPKKNGGFGGIVGAGVAGVILAAGLTLTYLSLSKRNASGLKPQMESLSAQQEVLLESDDQSDKVGPTGSENITPMPDKGCSEDDCSIESKTGINKDSSSSPEVNEATFESRHGDNISGGTSLLQNDESAFNSIDVVNNASSSEVLQIQPNNSDEHLPTDSNLTSPNISESDRVNVSVESSNLEGQEDDPDTRIQNSNTEPEGNFVSVSLDNLDASPITDASDLDGLEASPDAGMLKSNIEPGEKLISVNLDSSAVADADSINFKLGYQEEISNSRGVENPELPSEPSPGSGSRISDESLALDAKVMLEGGATSPPHVASQDVMETETPLSIKEDHEHSKIVQAPTEGISSTLEGHSLNENGSSETTPTKVTNPYANKPDTTTEIDGSSSFFESVMPENSMSPAGIPAPSLVSAALQVPPGKVVVPAVIDQVQGQALAALQVLKVIEADVKPTDLCTRREYVRWLVSASGLLSRNSVSKVYPAMYIENVTELAFDDVTPQDPDFTSIQGLAEAGLISSKLSRRDMLQSVDGENDSFLFFPESPLSRQDLVSWKMALEKRQLPEVDRKIVYQRCGFIDIDKINPDAWPALVADRSAGEHGIITLAFGYTRLFQPSKPVTKAQAAIALATGEAADIVSEELTRIEAESVAETAVAAHTALVAQVEKDINASFEKELAMEREKIDAIEKMAEEARLELERLRAEREEENDALARRRAAVESEMEVLSRLRRELEEQLQGLTSNKVELSFEKERINKLREEAENENQVIARLQYELEVERKALSMARSWAEDEAKRAREQAKALEEARDRWERHGIKVVVDDDLRDDANAGVTWLTAGKESTVGQTVGRAENLVNKLKEMASQIKGKSKAVIETIILKITLLISNLKEWAAETARQAGELQGSVVSKAGDLQGAVVSKAGELQGAVVSKAGELQGAVVSKAGELQGAVVSKASQSVHDLQQSTAGLSLALKDGAKRIADDCREGVEKISQKFKA